MLRARDPIPDRGGGGAWVRGHRIEFLRECKQNKKIHLMNSFAGTVTKKPLVAVRYQNNYGFYNNGVTYLNKYFLKNNLFLLIHPSDIQRLPVGAHRAPTSEVPVVWARILRWGVRHMYLEDSDKHNLKGFGVVLGSGSGGR